MYPNLASFISALESAGELVRIRAKVDPVLEIAQIADVVSKSRAPREPSTSARRNDPRFFMNGGPALLFENVEGAKFPLLINAWGSYSRMEMALGLSDVGGVRHAQRSGHDADGFEALAARIASLTKPQPPRSLGEMLAKGRELLPLLRIAPRRERGRGPCQEIVLQGDQIDLTQLPLLRCWPHDGDFEAVGYPAGVNDNIPGVRTDREWMSRYRGRYITLAGIHTIHADDILEAKPASHNIGMYRVQMFGPRTLSMHWHMHHDGARHWRSWKAKGQRMPVAIVLGGESIMPYAATAPLPPGISELLLAGFLNGKGIPMVRGVSVPLWVPANAEIVIEGYVSHEAGLIGWDPRDATAAMGSELERMGGASSALDRASIGKGAVFEGPFGDHTGFYSMPDRYPLLEVTAITHRRNAVYPTTIVGLPPQEDYYLGKATERIFLPLLKTIVHDIEDYDLPMFGAFHNCACIKIKKAYPLQGRRVMHSVWGAGQMAWTKCVIVVDDDVNVHDTMEVMRTVGERCHPTRDVEFVRGPVDILDHAAPHLGASQKMGLDATRKKGDAELHQQVESAAAQCAASRPLSAVTGDAARAAERRITQFAGVVSAHIPDGADSLAGWWLFIRIAKGQAGDGPRVIASLEALADEVAIPVWTIIVGEDCDIANADDVFFHWLAQGSFERDRFVSACGRRVAFDATPKQPGDERSGYPVRAWPPILRMSDEIVTRVQRRWSEYGIPGPIAAQ